ncbi:MAG: TonB-dependent receptor [Prevotellaceae bacterium]|jgi:TonB-linked SusC/RagA family outer membrane protein|nr:TonB-dependent receptor [Prevotellaceae bacterium]
MKIANCNFLSCKAAALALCALLLALNAAAQGKSVSGRVTDENREPLIGVTVQVKGTSIGAMTDTDGRFQIQVPDKNAVAIFSYIGYSRQEIVIGEQSVLNVEMSETNNLLEEVVVVGYGTQKKVNLVGAVSAVQVDEKISGRSVPNVSSALQGLMPGLQVTQNSGMAGNNSASLLIRGLGTVNNANPLIVVDDMPDVDINRINMNDIESISVLKDAAASSVYGSRAANGVILIKTKSGKNAGKTGVNVSASYAWENPTQSYEFMADYARALTLHRLSAMTTKSDETQTFKLGTIDEWLAMSMIDPVKYPNTDWFDLIMRTGSIQNYNVSASGSDEKANFFASIGYMKQEGLQINNDFDRLNLRFNFDYKLFKNITTGFKFDGNWSNYQFALSDGFTSGGSDYNMDMQNAVAGIYPYDAERNLYGGVMAYGEDPTAFNPVSFFNTQLKEQDRQEANLSTYLDWELLTGLTAHVDYSLSYYNQFKKDAPIPNQAYNFQTESYTSRYYVGNNAGISNTTNTGYKTLLNARLSYTKKFADAHDLSTLFVYSEESWFNRYQYAYRADRIYPTLSEIDAALTTTQATGGYSDREGLRSFIGRVNYTAWDKYLLEVNFRSDGSSKFYQVGGNATAYGFFPSAALGWRFSEESFIKNLTGKWLASGKLRFSYGGLGNNSGVGKYQQQEVLNQSNYMLDGAIANGFVYTKMLNEDLTWESTYVANAGLDLAFLNGKLYAEFDYYDRLTQGMLLDSDMSLLLSGAYEKPKANLGDLRNRGVEANITWNDRAGALEYSVNFNASYNRTNLETWSEYLGKGNVFLDMPYQFAYTYLDNGIAQTWQDVYDAASQNATPGDIVRLDVNGDGRVDGNDKVAYPEYQRNLPTTNFALNASLAWRGFDFAMLWQGATGRKDFWKNNYNVLTLPEYRYASTWMHWNEPWSYERRSASMPRLGGSVNNRDDATFWLDDMSYLRLKNIQLGYTLPKKWTEKVKVEKCRIYGSAENLLTFTKYRGLDPEKNGNVSDMYPLCRSYSVNLSIGF